MFPITIRPPKPDYQNNNNNKFNNFTSDVNLPVIIRPPKTNK